MTFATRPTVGHAVQLPITQCVWQSHLPSQIMCASVNAALLNANYSLPYNIRVISNFKIIFNKVGCFICFIFMYSCHD